MRDKLGRFIKGHIVKSQWIKAFQKANQNRPKIKKIKIVCEICNKIVYVYSCHQNRRFCSIKCAGKGHSKVLLNYYASGKEIGFQKGHKGYKHSKQFKKGHTPWNKDKFIQINTGRTHFKKGEHPSSATEFKKGQNMGSENLCWKGGITPLCGIIRGIPENKQWRDTIFQRDNYTCQKCGIHSGNGKTVYLEAHHIKPFAQILSEFLQEYNQFSPIDDKEILVRLAFNYKPFWNIDNGKTLCEDCHNNTKQGRKQCKRTRSA